MIDAARRILICRTKRTIKTDKLLVCDLNAWLDELVP